jgi:hypothetical protein
MPTSPVVVLNALGYIGFKVVSTCGSCEVSKFSIGGILQANLDDNFSGLIKIIIWHMQLNIKLGQFVNWLVILLFRPSVVAAGFFGGSFGGFFGGSFVGSFSGSFGGSFGRIHHISLYKTLPCQCYTDQNEDHQPSLILKLL